ncbi:MFS general substrate transporter [Lentinula edodes]|uniref:MFS general substrate transporter n=1 Tax=Lentinula lateritia TaxID=40482 RepID=A0A9W8ZZ85_9AGAR|nr:MFS general substrate transporter [Lentinula edodes]
MSNSDEADIALAGFSPFHKMALLIVVCVGQFLDTFSNSALFSAIPPICVELGISNSNSVWLQSGYQLTFAGLLLMSGRLSDLYNPKWVFIAGGLSLGIFSLAGGFVRSEVPLIALRALMGIGAALTVPSALYLIVHMYPDPTSQSKAVGIFTMSGGLGNLLGLVIGALFVSFASWPWIFYFISILAISESVLVFIMCLNVKRSQMTATSHLKRLERLDVIGVTCFTASVILFIFAVTSGSIEGWGSARVIACLILSFVLLGIFSVYETYIPTWIAVIPPQTWTYTNLPILIATALLPYLWWGAVQSLYSWYWQEIFGWSAIITAVHFLPLGLSAVPAAGIATMLQQYFPLKWVLMIGSVLSIIGSLLFPFGNSHSRYWSFVFPGFIIGSGGMSIVYVTANVALFASTTPEVAGVVSAIFNAAIQLGCAAGIAIATSIQTSIQNRSGDPSSYEGRAAAFWFVLAVTATIGALIAVLMKNNLPAMGQREQSQKERALETLEEKQEQHSSSIITATI